ncbi:hypothetical protein [Biostraticola tofi]|uniref:Uncharacterized protein n=1 Tax=Biostraticola tofi TaxID=466109 RepID=A0A4R3YXU1_9GAMM|nr:hypothetical protein [Biostraticola tofi]TCV96678.1 hypothetical protein EDC52_104118 [Biostraticola tofi]
MSELAISSSVLSSAFAAMTSSRQQYHAPLIRELQQVKNGPAIVRDIAGRPQNAVENAHCLGFGIGLSAAAPGDSQRNDLNRAAKESGVSGRQSGAIIVADDCRSLFKHQSIENLLGYASKDRPPIDHNSIVTSGGMACPYHIPAMAEACFLAMQKPLTSNQSRDLDGVIKKLASTMQKAQRNSPEALRNYDQKRAEKFTAIELEMTAVLKPILGSQPEAASAVLLTDVVDPFMAIYTGQQLKGVPLSLTEYRSMGNLIDQAALNLLNESCKTVANGGGSYISKLGLINFLLLGIPHYLVKPHNTPVEPLAESSNQQLGGPKSPDVTARVPTGLGSRSDDGGGLRPEGHRQTGDKGNGTATDGHPSGNIMINSGNTTINNHNLTIHTLFQPINIYNLTNQNSTMSFTLPPRPQQQGKMPPSAGQPAKKPLISGHTTPPPQMREPAVHETGAKPVILSDQPSLLTLVQEYPVTYSDEGPVYIAEVTEPPVPATATSTWPTVAPPASVITSVSGLRRANHPSTFSYPPAIKGIFAGKEPDKSGLAHAEPGKSPPESDSRPSGEAERVEAGHKPVKDWPEMIIPKPVLTSVPGLRRANQFTATRQPKPNM